MNYHSTVSELFNYFYYKIYKNANFKLDLAVNKQHTQVDNFIKLLAKHHPLPSVGVNFLIDYFCFAFHYWSDKDTKRKISLGWIIGKKTFKRWLERSDNYQYWYFKFLHEYDINLDQLRLQLANSEAIHSFENEAEKNGLDPAEELEKVRFTGEARLYNCLQHTTLYHHKSGTCLSCPNKRECKSLLRVKFPITYAKRDYK